MYMDGRVLNVYYKFSSNSFFLGGGVKGCDDNLIDLFFYRFEC